MTCNEAMKLKYRCDANVEILSHIIGLQTVSMLRNTEFKWLVIMVSKFQGMILEIRHSKMRYSICMLLNPTLIYLILSDNVHVFLLHLQNNSLVARLETTQEVISWFPDIEKCDYRCTYYVVVSFLSTSTTSPP